VGGEGERRAWTITEFSAALRFFGVREDLAF